MVGARLESVSADGVIVLHDRRIPGSRANIDHIVVCSLGVYVIDAKRYKDKQIERRTVGSLLRPGPPELFVGGRDKTALVEGMRKQVDAVRAELEDVAPQVPVTPVLCFVEGLWSFRPKPFTIDGVVVTFPKALAAALEAGTGEFAEVVATVGARLSERLKPA